MNTLPQEAAFLVFILTKVEVRQSLDRPLPLLSGRFSSTQVPDGFMVV